MKRTTWYHITSFDHGPTMEVAHRPPLLRTESEPSTPRLCVCDRLPGCFAAVLLPIGPVYVYSVQRRAVAPIGVWDAAITGERWLIPPVQLKLDRVIPAHLVRDIYAATHLRMEVKLRKSTWKVRLAQYLVAARVLRMNRKWIESYWRDTMGDVDPEEFIIKI